MHMGRVGGIVYRSYTYGILYVYIHVLKLAYVTGVPRVVHGPILGVFFVILGRPTTVLFPSLPHLYNRSGVEYAQTRS